MTEISNQPKRKSFLDISLSDTLLLAVLPFLAYLFAFVYQAGYLKAFELPLQFVSITTTDVFNIGGKVLGVFAIILGSINVFSSFLPKGRLPYPLAKRFSQLVPIFLFAIPALFFYKWGTASYLFAFLLIFAIILMFFPALVTRKYKGPYLHRMEMIDKEVTDINPTNSNPFDGSLFARTVNLIGYKVFIVIVYLLLSLYITYYAGKSTAQNQEVFYIANTSPDTVVLFMTNEKIISAPFDKTTRVIEPEFMVINIGDTADLKLRLSNIGRLSLDTSSMTPLLTPTSTPPPTQTLTVTPLPIATRKP